jgi:hypothetical protein
MTDEIRAASAIVKPWIDRVLTHSRKAAIAGWLLAVWGALEVRGKLVWPPDRETWMIVIGATVTLLSRSLLAPPKAPPPESEGEQ